MKNNRTRKPARSKKEKGDLRQDIIEKGRELFSTKGSYGFKTRALAEKLNMSQGNLYNYVKSKRELWIAIRIEDYKKMITEVQDIIDNHEGSRIDLLKEIAIYYLDFATKERNRFQMLFRIPPPPAKEKGPIEKNYKRKNPLNLIKHVLIDAMDAREIKERDVNQVAYIYYALLQGATFVEIDLRSRDEILEPITEENKAESIKKFRNTLLKDLEHLLKG